MLVANAGGYIPVLLKLLNGAGPKSTWGEKERGGGEGERERALNSNDNRPFVFCVVLFLAERRRASSRLTFTSALCREARFSFTLAVFCAGVNFIDAGDRVLVRGPEPMKCLLFMAHINVRDDVATELQEASWIVWNIDVEVVVGGRSSEEQTAHPAKWRVGGKWPRAPIRLSDLPENMRWGRGRGGDGGEEGEGGGGAVRKCHDLFTTGSPQSVSGESGSPSGWPHSTPAAQRWR